MNCKCTTCSSRRNLPRLKIGSHCHLYIQVIIQNVWSMLVCNEKIFKILIAAIVTRILMLQKLYHAKKINNYLWLEIDCSTLILSHVPFYKILNCIFSFNFNFDLKVLNAQVEVGENIIINRF